MAADENFSPIILISFCSHRFPFSLVIASLGGVSVIDGRHKKDHFAFAERAVEYLEPNWLR